ncbi:high mobility group box domain-containing protein [Halteromyces radiatus]|uniref:high mobility group box domain-containing protein n=1 Tax=Halteromyces radiatus TaxID=101107 RepID=UPI00221E9772|nr:high mobility group box domain-containing protein [Halteromyces radiatus]KAI8098567.1 high mobility group box domain-containing protein [Halteromyces radiatus]
MMNMDDDHKEKYTKLKKRIRDIERENDFLHVRIHKARKSVRRLRLERTFLLDRIEKINHHYSVDESEDEVHSDQEHTIIPVTSSNHSSKTIKPKKKKDPNAPKGPGNVFFLFCRLQRDKIKDEHPEERSLGEVTKLLSAKWKGLDKEEKKVYQDMYQKELEEYEVAMKSYNSSNNPHAMDEDVISSSAAPSPAP